MKNRGKYASKVLNKKFYSHLFVQNAKKPIKLIGFPLIATKVISSCTSLPSPVLLYVAHPANTHLPMLAHSASAHQHW